MINYFCFIQTCSLRLWIFNSGLWTTLALKLDIWFICRCDKLTFYVFCSTCLYYVLIILLFLIFLIFNLAFIQRWQFWEFLARKKAIWEFFSSDRCTPFCHHFEVLLFLLNFIGGVRINGKVSRTLFHIKSLALCK